MLYQAIETKFAGPTNHNGSRVIAKCEAKRMIVGWDHALNQSDNHAAAAKKLAEALGWRGPWAGGGTASGYVFVSIPSAAHDEKFVEFVV